MRTPFPPIAAALSEPNGLLAAGGDLSPDRLLAAYRHGIFPWFSEGQPILWWSTDPRMVLVPAEFRVHRSLRKTISHLLAQGRLEIRFDPSFAEVIRSCSASPRPGQSGTWIVPQMLRAYAAFHEA